MNPFMIVWAMARRHPGTTLLFIGVIAVAVSLGVGVTAQERAFRQGSAMASDRFDLLIAAPGSPFETVLNTIFLRPSAVQLLDPEVTAKALTDTRAEYAAPIGFGDNVRGLQVIGTISQFVDRLSGGVQDGRLFQHKDEAVLGASVPFQIGDVLEPNHGTTAFVGSTGEAIEQEGEHKHYELTVVGRMKPTGNPWDRAIIVPIESIWAAHNLPDGHPEGSGAIGPPYDPAHTPGLPAIVMKGRTIADMYGLRGEYRSERSMAFFPAEVLLQVYDLVGNVRQVMSVMAVVTQVLTFLAIFAGLFALMKLFERQFAVLRALGASRSYVFSSVWLFACLIIITGVALGLGLGFSVAQVASNILARATSISLSAALGPDEMSLAFLGAALGIGLATIPAALLYRRPVADLLR